jgi:hypothetical protein
VVRIAAYGIKIVPTRRAYEEGLKLVIAEPGTP